MPIIQRTEHLKFPCAERDVFSKSTQSKNFLLLIFFVIFYLFLTYINTDLKFVFIYFSCFIKRTLEREVRKCQALVIWTDGDREGENIGFEIIECCQNGLYNYALMVTCYSQLISTFLIITKIYHNKNLVYHFLNIDID